MIVKKGLKLRAIDDFYGVTSHKNGVECVIIKVLKGDLTQVMITKSNNNSPKVTSEYLILTKSIDKHFEIIDKE